MRILKSDTYINEKLDIKPVTKDMLAYYKQPYVDEETIRFIKDNNLIWNPVTKSYDCDGNVQISKDKSVIRNGRFIIKFGRINGDFECYRCELESLNGAPQYVGGYFNCSENELESLEGAPQEVKGDFNCGYNKLKTLNFSPKIIYGDFYCNNNELTSLEGAPQKVNGSFYCNDNGYNLKTLESAPQVVRGDFYCQRNPYILDSFSEQNFRKSGHAVIGQIHLI